MGLEHLLQAGSLHLAPGAVAQPVLLAILMVCAVLVGRGHIEVRLALDAGTLICAAGNQPCRQCLGSSPSACFVVCQTKLPVPCAMRG